MHRLFLTLLVALVAALVTPALASAAGDLAAVPVAEDQGADAAPAQTETNPDPAQEEEPPDDGQGNDEETTDDPDEEEFGEEVEDEDQPEQEEEPVEEAAPAPAPPPAPPAAPALPATGTDTAIFFAAAALLLLGLALRRVTRTA